SHYFPAPQQADARPFAHILASDSVPSDIPALAPAPALAAAAHEPTTARREPTIGIAPAAQQDFAAEALAELPQPAASGAAGEAMGTELKTLRRMLETQLAQLAWNDLTRRAPVHVEILRELTEIGITQDLSDYILKQ